VGQRVTLSHETIRRRALYKIGDQAGVSALLEKGNTVYKAAMMCTGVIVNAIEDNQLQTDVTYAPVCFMFQLSWACRHAPNSLRCTPCHTVTANCSLTSHPCYCRERRGKRLQITSAIREAQVGSDGTLQRCDSQSHCSRVTAGSGGQNLKLLPATRTCVRLRILVHDDNLAF
jgi:hypothetical protein